MAVTIVKKESATKAKPEIAKESDVRQAAIERMAGQVDGLYAKKMKVDSSKKVLAKVSKVYKDAMDAFMSDVPDLELGVEDELVIDGDKHIAKIGAEGKTREVKDNKLVFEMLNSIQEDLAYELMSFGLGVLDKYLTPDQLEKVLKKGHSGTRSVALK